ncbi:MAG TPA: VWA domain-containing protein [Polyangiaceae bacterium]|nr:VWA domain-containing protein [Polyangiaceae bacterium]
MRNALTLGMGWLVVGMGIVACTTSKAGGTPDAATGGTGAVGNQGTQAVAVAGQPDAAREAFHFQPRVHEPHPMPAVAPLPPLPAMPRFVDGAARCFPRQPDYYGYGPQKRPSQTRMSASSGYGGLGASGTGSGGGGRLGGSHSAPKAAAGAADANSAPATAQAAPAAEAKRKDDSYGVPASRPASPAPSPAATTAPGTAPPQDRARYEAKGESERDGNYDKRSADEPMPQHYQGRQPDWGAAIYLSNDDTMSLSSAQRVIWAIDHYAPVPASQVRPHELLNYFSFQTQPVALDHDFSVLPNIAPSTEDPNLLTLSLSVQGRPLTQSSRRNANLAYVIDRSGSMAAEGRMEYLKRGLLRSLRELKMGDVVHLVLFDTNSCDLAQNFVVGRDSMARMEQLIGQIQPLGSTNLHDGLTQGYAAVDRTYQPTYTNRVVLVTDAIANTGVTDENLISMVGKHYDERKVRLSGVGVGSDFNDSLLDGLTERGKGAYVFLGSEAEVDAVFGNRFVSLIETIATDVHFRLHLPPSLAMQTFYGEEASTSKERVQSIHYFANTSQLFLSDLISRDRALPARDDLMLTIEYQDPESGAARVEEFAWNLGAIAGRAPNLDKGMLLNVFARELASISERPVPGGYYERAGGWNDSSAAQRCYQVRSDLERLGAGLTRDPEVQRVRGLWDRVCSRYVPVQPVYQPPVYRNPQPEPRPPTTQPPTEWPAQPPTRNNDYAPPSGWPSASK